MKRCYKTYFHHAELWYFIYKHQTLFLSLRLKDSLIASQKLRLKQAMPGIYWSCLIGNKQGEKTDQNLLKVNSYSRKTSFTKSQFFKNLPPPPSTHVTLCNFFDQPPSLPCHILKKWQTIEWLRQKFFLHICLPMQIVSSQAEKVRNRNLITTHTHSLTDINVLTGSTKQEEIILLKELVFNNLFQNGHIWPFLYW